MKVPPIDIDELASIPPGKVRVSDAIESFELFIEDARRSIVESLVSNERITDAERADAIAHVERATENARLNYAEQLFAQTQGRH
jgi:hypothetical protein